MLVTSNKGTSFTLKVAQANKNTSIGISNSTNQSAKHNFSQAKNAIQWQDLNSPLRKSLPPVACFLIKTKSDKNNFVDSVWF